MDYQKKNAKMQLSSVRSDIFVDNGKKNNLKLQRSDMNISQIIVLANTPILDPFPFEGKG